MKVHLAKMFLSDSSHTEFELPDTTLINTNEGWKVERPPKDSQHVILNVGHFKDAMIF